MARSRKLRPATLGSVERLEKRQVMTAGVATAQLLPGGLLKITGTSNAYNPRLIQFAARLKF